MAKVEETICLHFVVPDKNAIKQTFNDTAQPDRNQSQQTFNINYVTLMDSEK